MTTQDQIELLEILSNDMDTHKALFDNFKDCLSKSPISGTEEEVLKANYIDLGISLQALYMVVIKAIADWLTQQP